MTRSSMGCRSGRVGAALLVLLAVGCGDPGGGRPDGPDLPDWLDDAKADHGWAFGGDLAHCRSGDVHTIARPYLHADPEAGTFDLAFRRIRGFGSDAPTIVLLEGGPGDWAMNKNHVILGLPPVYDLVLVDVRGVGCNALPPGVEAPAEFYRTREIVEDVLAIIELLGLNDYVLYGRSYGTLVATVAAHQAADRVDRLGQPRALVLEGAIGRTLTDGEALDGYQQVWRHVRDELSPEVRAALARPGLMGFTPEEWGTYVSIGLREGRGPPTPGMLARGELPPHQLVDLLSMLDPSLPPEFRLALAEHMRRLLSVFLYGQTDENRRRMFMLIMCQELAHSYRNSFFVQDGDLLSTSDTCAGISVDVAYHARDWPVSVPVYYFHGELDPATPAWQVQVHRESQTQVPSTLVLAKGAGHAAMKHYADCAGALWQAMTRAESITPVLSKQCWWPSLYAE